MATYEEKRVVATDPDLEPATTAGVVETAPETVVERRPTRTVVANNDDPIGSTWAATQMIQTIVWAIVVLVLLAVALMALHVYAHLF